jgi:hypothetical protein
VSPEQAIVAVVGAAAEDASRIVAEWVVGPVVSLFSWKHVGRAFAVGGGTVKTQLLVDMGFVKAGDVPS